MSTKNYFIDTEFGYEHGHCTLISVGIVSDDGREFYAQNADCSPALHSQWVKDNVHPQLDPKGWSPLEVLVANLRAFLGQDDPSDRQQFWAYYAAYDWYLFLELWNRADDGELDLPASVNFCVYDLKQYAGMLGVRRSKYPKQTDGAHHALADARWNRELWQAVNSVAPVPAQAQSTESE